MFYLMLLITAVCMPLGFSFGRAIGHGRRRAIAPMRRTLG